MFYLCKLSKYELQIIAENYKRNQKNVWPHILGKYWHSSFFSILLKYAIWLH